MAPMQETLSRKERIMVEVKEIIKKYTQGMQVTKIARFYKKSKLTIFTILKRK